MDSRDIKEEPVKVPQDNILSQMYLYQKELIDHYVGIEGLPPYPLNINTKKNQVIFKDFVGRVVEELAECAESMDLVAYKTKNNKFWTELTQEKNGEFDVCISYLQNIGEELVDAIHFMLELLIYANIQPVDISGFINKYLKDILGDVHMGPLVEAYQVGKTLCENLSVVATGKKVYPVDITFWYDFYTHGDGLDRRLLKAGHMYHTDIYASIKLQFWEVTYHLNLARNYLKNKPWKQSQMISDETKFQSELVTAFIYLMGVSASLGLNPDDIYWLYFKKNRVNMFRIKSKY